MENLLSIHPSTHIVFLIIIGISVTPWSSSNEIGFLCVMYCIGSEQDDSHCSKEFKAKHKTGNYI